MLYGGIEETIVNNPKDGTSNRKIGPTSDVFFMKLAPSKYL